MDGNICFVGEKAYICADFQREMQRKFGSWISIGIKDRRIYIQDKLRNVHEIDANGDVLSKMGTIVDLTSFTITEYNSIEANDETTGLFHDILASKHNCQIQVDNLFYFPREYGKVKRLYLIVILENGEIEHNTSMEYLTCDIKSDDGVLSRKGNVIQITRKGGHTCSFYASTRVRVCYDFVCMGVKGRIYLFSS